MNAFSQANHLNKKLTLSFTNLKIDEALDVIENKGNFTFSYNSDMFDLDRTVSLDVQSKSVNRVLKDIFHDNVRYKVVGNHIVLLNKQKKKVIQENKKSEYLIAGYIIDSRTGQRIKEAIVYEVDGRVAAISNSEGYYQMTLPANLEQGVSYSKNGYLDTVIIVRPVEQKNLDIRLNPLAYIPEKIKVEYANIAINDIHDRGLVNMFVPEESKVISENLKLNQTKAFQVSLVPYLGTNRKLSGSLNNVFSFNLLAGYSGGVNGFEFGGLVNIDRKNVNGAQIGGAVNIVGGKVKGLQLAGFFNKNSGSIKGVQIAGFNNVVLDTVTGLQLAGFQNTLHGRMDGVQLSGFNNVTTQHVDGLQITGFANVAVKDVKLAQIGGFANYADNVDGIQIGGFANVAKGSVNWGQISGFANYGRAVGGVQASGFANVSIEGNSGSQLAGFANYADSVSGVQISGFANVSLRDVDGVQISGFANYTKKLKGVQLSAFNYCDTVESGIPIGFISYVRTGYHKVEAFTDEVFYANASFKTGVEKFYNEISIGYGYKNIFYSGYGIGTILKKRKNLSLALELGSKSLMHANDEKVIGLLNSLTLNLDYKISKQMSLFVAPMLNVYVYDEDPAGSKSNKIATYAFYEDSMNSFSTQIWVGAKAGLGIYF